MGKLASGSRSASNKCWVSAGLHPFTLCVLRVFGGAQAGAECVQLCSFMSYSSPSLQEAPGLQIIWIRNVLAAGIGLGKLQLLGLMDGGYSGQMEWFKCPLGPVWLAIPKFWAAQFSKDVVCRLRAELAQPVTVPATLVSRGSFLQWKLLALSRAQ